jgi:hypothetical protein
MKKILVVISFAWLPLVVLAQSSSSWSAFSGGMIVGQSILSTTKFGYEKKHFGLSADFTFDNYREKWNDGSKSKFDLYGVSVGARYYTRSMGRGFFAEGFGGYGLARLTTNQSTQKQQLKESEYLPVSGVGLGYRFGRKPKGPFGEVAYRATVPLKNVHLYTTDDKPDPQAVSNISYQSWIFEKGKASGQFYVGIGYSF